MTARRTAIVAGAFGAVGRTLVQHLEASGGWDVVGIGRRAAAPTARTRHLQLDLTDADACARAPFTGTVWPVMYAFPTTISTACATSSGRPRRPSGTFLAYSSRRAAIISVSVSDGETAFTVTPSRTSRAA